MAKFRLDLRDPSMTFLHRAGVAGLFVQLKYLEQLNLQPPHGLHWSLTKQSVEMDWTGRDLDILQWLCDKSFQIDSDGLIYFPAIAHSLNFRQRLAIHISLKKTFLQHNKFYKSCGKTIKEDRDRQIKYGSCQSYVHQRGPDFLCDPDGNLQSKYIKITGWIYPGATVKHEAMREATQFAESPPNFFALLFAPLACSYFRVSSDYELQQVQTGLVIPEVSNLEEFLQLRNAKTQPAIYFQASGWADAGLRFLLQATAVKQPKQGKLLRCLVILFGIVPWAKQQHTRLAIETIAIDAQYLDRYNTLCRAIQNATALKFSLLLLEQNCLIGYLFLSRLVHLDNSLSNPLLPFVAENLIRGKPWWWGFADFFSMKKHI